MATSDNIPLLDTHLLEAHHTTPSVAEMLLTYTNSPQEPFCYSINKGFFFPSQNHPIVPDNVAFIHEISSFGDKGIDDFLCIGIQAMRDSIPLHLRIGSSQIESTQFSPKKAGSHLEQNTFDQNIYDFVKKLSNSVSSRIDLAVKLYEFLWLPGKPLNPHQTALSEIQIGHIATLAHIVINMLKRKSQTNINPYYVFTLRMCNDPEDFQTQPLPSIKSR